jgi:hypothetical protein
MSISTNSFLGSWLDESMDTMSLATRRYGSEVKSVEKVFPILVT